MVSASLIAAVTSVITATLPSFFAAVSASFQSSRQSALWLAGVTAIMKTAVARNFTFRLVWFFSNNTPDYSSLKARQGYIFDRRNGQVSYVAFASEIADQLSHSQPICLIRSKPF